MEVITRNPKGDPYFVRVEALGKMTWQTYLKLERVDAGLIGTLDYLGMAKFWGDFAEEFMGEASLAKRRRVHANMLVGWPQNGCERADVFVPDDQQKAEGMTVWFPDHTAPQRKFWLRAMEWSGAIPTKYYPIPGVRAGGPK